MLAAGLRVCHHAPCATFSQPDRMPAGPGRPSEYTPELAEDICRRLSEGESLREICRHDAMPAEAAVRLWAAADRGGFHAQYTKARQAQALRWAEEITEIADNGSNDWMERNDPDNPGYAFNGEHYQRSRLRVDARKWMLSKVLPKVYGERLSHEVSGPEGGPIAVAVDHRISAAAGVLDAIFGGDGKE